MRLTSNQIKKIIRDELINENKRKQLLKEAEVFDPVEGSLAKMLRTITGKIIDDYSVPGSPGGGLTTWGVSAKSSGCVGEEEMIAGAVDGGDWKVVGSDVEVDGQQRHVMPIMYDDVVGKCGSPGEISVRFTGSDFTGVAAVFALSPKGKLGENIFPYWLAYGKKEGSKDYMFYVIPATQRWGMINVNNFIEDAGPNVSNSVGEVELGEVPKLNPKAWPKSVYEFVAQNATRYAMIDIENRAPLSSEPDQPPADTQDLTPGKILTALKTKYDKKPWGMAIKMDDITNVYSNMDMGEWELFFSQMGRGPNCKEEWDLFKSSGDWQEEIENVNCPPADTWWPWN